MYIIRLGMILNGLIFFFKNNVNGTRDPPPFMANVIKNVHLFFGNTSLRRIYFKNVEERVWESFGVSLFQEMCPTCRTTSTNGKTLSKDCIFPLSHIDPFNFANSLTVNYILFQQPQQQVEIKQCQKYNGPERWVLLPTIWFQAMTCRRTVSENHIFISQV